MYGGDLRGAVELFKHSALMYSGEDQYLDGIVPFIEDGLSAGEAVLVAVPRPRLELLRGSIPASDLLAFARMEELGSNPAWIIPAWHDFVGAQTNAGRSARGVGEPIWAARTPDEVVECGRHESLLNLAFADAAGFTLLCPYDADALAHSVIEEAHVNHPEVGGPGRSTPSSAYRAEVPALIDTPLSAVPDSALTVSFTGDDMASVRRSAGRMAAAAHVTPARVEDLMVAVSEAVSNSIRHGGGSGELALWHDHARFMCEIRDRGRISEALAGRIRPEATSRTGRGLWLMHQLCDLVQIRAVSAGQVVRLHMAI